MCQCSDCINRMVRKPTSLNPKGEDKCTIFRIDLREFSKELLNKKCPLKEKREKS